MNFEIFGEYENRLLSYCIMGKAKSLAQQIAALDEPIAKGLLSIWSTKS
jgi:hypothetical protein